MKIWRFLGENVHGYLRFDIAFHPDLTFLTGINGSGKTTAVRSIVALFTPSLRDLANLAFDRMRVDFERDGEPLFVEATRDGDSLSLAVSGASESFPIPILRPERYEPQNRYLDRESDFYREQESLLAKHPVLEFLSGLPTPMYLDLERRSRDVPRRSHVVGVGSGATSVRRASFGMRGGVLVDSLVDAQDLAENEFRKVQAEQNALTDRLKQDIILAAFALPASDAGIRKHVEIPTKSYAEEIEHNEQLVDRTLLSLGVSEDKISQHVRPFFDTLRRIVLRFPSGKKLDDLLHGTDEKGLRLLSQWFAFEPQERQINRVVHLVQEYNRSQQQHFAPMQRYLDSINQFLCDSGKELRFDVTGNLVISIGESTPRPITSLSSGERQLVVILTHLAFNRRAKRANVLIIDEPELSLHLRWQELFVDSVQKASPDLQLILATHSPAIILDRVEKCVDVAAVRKSDGEMDRSES